MASAYDEKFITESFKLWIPVEKYLFNLQNKTKSEKYIYSNITKFIEYMENKYKNKDYNDLYYEDHVHFPPKFSSNQKQLVKTTLLIDLDYFTQIEKKYHDDKYRSAICNRGTECFFPLSCKYAHNDIVDIIMNTIRFQTPANENQNANMNTNYYTSSNIVSSYIPSPESVQPHLYSNSHSYSQSHQYSHSHPNPNIHSQIIETVNQINTLSNKKKRKAELTDDYDQLADAIDKKYEEIQCLKDSKRELKKKIQNYKDDIDSLEENIVTSSKLLVYTKTNSKAITFLNSFL
jgi:DNA repair exonuclease SbcCD ATPase subunit